MSFSHTQEQIVAGTKTVTRRTGWQWLRPGDRVLPVNRLPYLPGSITLRPPLRIVNVRRERLDALLADREYGRAECVREGFPELEPEAFIELVCRINRGCTPKTELTRIEFEYE